MSSINPLSPTPAQTTSPTRSTGADSLADPNTFLQLLVAELKNQDPMNPSDPNQYLAQTAQFTMVQKINDLDTQMTSMLASSQQAAAAALIGRQIVGSTASGTPVSGVVSGLQMSNGAPLLVVGGKTLPMSNVTSVSETSTAATAAPATTPPAPTDPATTAAPVAAPVPATPPTQPA
ncbi:MAG TPA: flagellar hook capping FlgD N-terminal domain-containing protein [Acidimicrobiales bacterium]|nr:flagellar hook capping FlgD N-terminal domain-containing protein [Acidimicrobiales bacterium]